MEPESPKLRKVSHIGLWVYALISAIVLGWLLWAATHSKTTTKNESFSDKATQTNNYNIKKPATTNYGLAFVNIAFFPMNLNGCTKADKIVKDYPGEDTDDITNSTLDTKVIINAMASHEEKL